MHCLSSAVGGPRAVVVRGRVLGACSDGITLRALGSRCAGFYAGPVSCVSGFVALKRRRILTGLSASKVRACVSGDFLRGCVMGGCKQFFDRVSEGGFETGM